MTESRHQIELFYWARLQANIHPELRLLYAIPNGGKRDKITASRLRAEGAKPGVSDVNLPCPRGGFAGLWIEMKAPASVSLDGKKTRAGVLSDDQIQWLNAMAEEGHRAEVCYGWEHARDVILDYLKAGQ